MEGWIKLHRQIIESPVFAHPTALKIWVWCLCKASRGDRTVSMNVGNGVSSVALSAGQFIFGRHKAEEELSIDGSTIYKWMQKFSSPEYQMVTIDSNNKFSVVTILKFSEFQDNEKTMVAATEQQENNSVAATEQQRNTYKNYNTDKKVKNVLRDEIFFDEVYIEQLKMIHRDKDLKQAFEECYLHFSQQPHPPKELWQWKQKLSTWLTFKKEEPKSQNGKLVL